jgi:hypothetical protein
MILIKYNSNIDQSVSDIHLTEVDVLYTHNKTQNIIISK